MTLPIGCAWCGLPLDVEGFDHHACTTETERDYGAMPCWWYHHGRDSDAMWGEVIGLHLHDVQQAAAAWAIEVDLTDKERAAYVVQVREAAEEMAWRQRMQSQRPYLERKALAETVTEERRQIAAHRAPDGSAFQGVL